MPAVMSASSMNQQMHGSMDHTYLSPTFFSLSDHSLSSQGILSPSSAASTKQQQPSEYQPTQEQQQQERLSFDREHIEAQRGVNKDDQEEEDDLQQVFDAFDQGLSFPKYSVHPVPAPVKTMLPRRRRERGSLLHAQLSAHQQQQEPAVALLPFRINTTTNRRSSPFPQPAAFARQQSSSLSQAPALGFTTRTRPGDEYFIRNPRDREEGDYSDSDCSSTASSCFTPVKRRSAPICIPSRRGGDAFGNGLYLPQPQPQRRNSPSPPTTNPLTDVIPLPALVDQHYFSSAEDESCSDVDDDFAGVFGGDFEL